MRREAGGGAVKDGFLRDDNELSGGGIHMQNIVTENVRRYQGRLRPLHEEPRF